MAIVNFILANWLEWLYALVIFFLSLLYGNVVRHLKNERAKNEAIAEGVQSLLRENIVGNYNKYQDRKGSTARFMRRNRFEKRIKRIITWVGMMWQQSYTQLFWPCQKR